MAEIKIDIRDLKAEGGDLIKELAEFLKEKTHGETEVATDEVTVKGEEKVSKVQVRTLLRKFLYKQGLRDYFRIIGGKENALVVKEIKVEEEEE